MNRTRVTMRREALGAEDGIRAFYYEAGKTYDLGPALSSVFLREGWGELAAADVTVTVPRRPTTADELRIGSWRLVTGESSAAQEQRR